MNVNSSFLQSKQTLPLILLFFATTHVLGESLVYSGVFESHPKLLFDTIPVSSVKNETAQESSTDENKIYPVVEKAPEFPGGINTLMHWVISNLTYPIQARRKGIEGSVYISFVIEKDGSVSSPEVRNSSKRTKLLEREAVRIVSMMPDWIPGSQEGRPVRVMFTMPIKFSLN